MAKKTFTAKISNKSNSVACWIELPFSPKEVFGSMRAPVNVTVRGYTYRSTTFKMSGMIFVPFNKAAQEGTKCFGGEKVRVIMESDTSTRIIRPPIELAKVLKTNPALHTVWKSLSYTNKKEIANSIKDAKRDETKQRRLEKAIVVLKNATTRHG